MKKGIKIYPTRIDRSKASIEMEAKSIEETLYEALQKKEPIKVDNSGLNYTERKDGVLPIYDIRTDRFEIARQATDKVNATNAAKRHLEDHPELYMRNEDGTFILGENGKPQLIHTGGEA